MTAIRASASSRSNSMIQLIRLSKTYGTSKSVLALRGLSLEIPQRERVAVMEPSGSGKTTLRNLVCALDQPTSGSVRVEGVELAGWNEDARTRLRR